MRASTDRRDDTRVATVASGGTLVAVASVDDGADAGVGELVAFVRAHPRLFVLTGAGLSTASGIPDYRDADGQWKRPPPVMLKDFLDSPAVRQRYWARSMLGWPQMAAAAPNAGHAAMAALQAAGKVERLVTQNVDGLHRRAGSAEVIELHGSLSQVTCLACGVSRPRSEVQRELERANPHFASLAAPAAPDGDAVLDARHLPGFVPPVCPSCAGIVKPDVVFFGENVPRSRVEAARAALARADAMLVVGSSLMVYSGYRFCEWAHRGGKPIAALNQGRTRADPLLTLKVAAPCAETLVRVVEALGLRVASDA